LIIISFNPVFNLPVNKLHEDGLRAYPSAEYPSEYNCEEHNENYESDH
jgi:hypothetical protein